MLYLLAFFLPPLAILLCGKPLQALLNILLCLLLWIPGIIHAMIVIGETRAEDRHQRLLRSMEEGRNNL